MEEDKNIEKFTKDILNEIGLEKPSASFVGNVMNIVNLPITEKKTVYKPLISKKVWILIAACFVGILTLAFTLPTDNSLFDIIGFNINTNISFNFLKGISLSNPFIYALIVFGLLLLVQVYMLKNNFDKQIGTF